MIWLIKIFIIFASLICAEIGNKDIIINALLSTDGTPEQQSIFILNKMKEIQLTQGHVALVDDEDFEYLNQWKWCALKLHNTCYAIRNNYIGDINKPILMHRQIMGLKQRNGIVIDHINHQGCDNRRENLRICTQSENSMNRQARKNCTSKYKGVYLHSAKQFNKTKQHISCYVSWRAEIRLNGKKKHIGTFKSETEAACAYNIAAIKHFGEFAHLNIMP